jgi:hypothetical protein
VNVEEAFQEIARRALKKEQQEETYLTNTVNLNQPKAPAKKKACC